MKLEDYKKKAAYLRDLGQTAIADDMEEMIERIKSLESEKQKLNSMVTMLLRSKK